MHGVARRRVLATVVGGLGSMALPRRARGAPFDDAPALPVVAPKLQLGAAARTQILYVIIDRPEDANPSDHVPNLDGLSAAVEGFDPSVKVAAITLADLAGLDAATLDTTWRPLAIYGAGSFTEWHMYGRDFAWRQRLDHWMDLVRATTIPMLAVCGSHQLVGIAFNGFGAVAHMANQGDPVRISDELSLVMPCGMWPEPRVGEEGTYPIVATSAGEADPLVRATASAPMAASHHKDMVVDASGFTLLYEGDASRAAATTASDQASPRCRVQGMRRDDRSRLLYSVQFHPEMPRFRESSTGDGGFGASFIAAFLARAKAWWAERDEEGATAVSTES
jgi:GMP synthase-like glutamine amidotransferase